MTSVNAVFVYRADARSIGLVLTRRALDTFRTSRRRMPPREIAAACLVL